MSENKKVVLYTRPGCGGCMLVANWLTENNVEFNPADVSVDNDARNKMVDAGYVSLPLLEVNGEFVLNEYHPEKLEELFG